MSLGRATSGDDPFGDWENVIYPVSYQLRQFNSPIYYLQRYQWSCLYVYISIDFIYLSIVANNFHWYRKPIRRKSPAVIIFVMTTGRREKHWRSIWRHLLRTICMYHCCCKTYGKRHMAKNFSLHHIMLSFLTHILSIFDNRYVSCEGQITSLAWSSKSSDYVFLLRLWMINTWTYYKYIRVSQLRPELYLRH